MPAAEEARQETEPTGSGGPEPAEAGGGGEEGAAAAALPAEAEEKTPARLTHDGAQSITQKDNGRLSPVEAAKGGQTEGPPPPKEEPPPLPASQSAPPVPASCGAPEDAPKPRPSPASQPNPPDFYCVKWISWKGERTPVIMQSENGPCPLLAIMNILFLQWKVKAGTGTGRGGTGGVHRQDALEGGWETAALNSCLPPGETACPEGSGHFGRADGLPR